MLTGIMLAVFLVWVLGAILTAVYLRCAPEGYEDETGFHFVEGTASAGRDMVRVTLREPKKSFG